MSTRSISLLVLLAALAALLVVPDVLLTVFAGILLAVPEKGIPQQFHVLVSPLLRTP